MPVSSNRQLNYWQIRYAIYRQQLKHLLDNIKNTSWAILAFMQAATPALFFVGLYCLGQIAEPSTTLKNYTIYTNIYLAIVFTAIRIQKSGIVNHPYELYLHCIPTTPTKKILTDISLILIAGNIFLAAPIVISIAMLSSGLESAKNFWFDVPSQLFSIMVCLLLSFILAWHAAFKKHLPLLSLVLYPLIILTLGESWGKLTCLSLWLVILLVEPHILSLFKLRKSLSTKYYFNILILFNTSNNALDITRVICLTIIAVLVNVAHTNLVGLNWHYALIVALFFSSIVISTVQFDLLKFEKTHQYFLMQQPTGSLDVYARGQFYTLCKQLLFIVLVMSAIPWHWLSAIVAPILVVSSSWAIRKLTSYFFLIPLALTCILISLTHLSLINW